MPQIEEQVKETTRQFYQKGIFSNKKVICFGFNLSTKCSMNYLKEKSIQPCYIFDNKPTASSYQNVPVIKPFFSEELKNAVILIGSKYEKGMTAQLVGLGYQKTQVFLTLKNFSDKINSLGLDIFHDKIDQIREGAALHKKLLTSYGQDLQILVSPSFSIGDVYLIEYFLPAYLKKYNISNYLILVRNRGGEKICQIFHEKNYLCLNNTEALSLCRYARFAGETEVSIKILNVVNSYTNNCRNFVGLGYNTFSDCFRYFFYELGKDARGKHPVYEKSMRIHSLLSEYGCTKGKTVVLSPYANYIKPLPEAFWEQLSRQLSAAGYTVCTNCGNKNEPPVFSTKRLNIELEDFVPFIEEAGYFIGLRSGLCDLASPAKAVKIGLYPAKWAKTEKNFFGLNDMGLCSDETALFLNDNTDDLIKKIMSVFQIDSK